MSELRSTQRLEAALQAPLGSDIVAAAKQTLAAFGDLPSSRRNELVTQLAPGIASLHRTGVSAADAANAELNSQLERWLAAGFGAGAPSVAAFRCAFLDVEGARRWPEQLLRLPVLPEFERALEKALPRGLPPEAPLGMPDQTF